MILNRDPDAFGASGRFQRAKTPGAGASGYRVCNRMDAGGADCASVPCGSAALMGTGCEGFLGASAVRWLRAGLSLLFDTAFVSALGFCGEVIEIARGKSSGDASGSPRLPVSSHREMASFSSSIDAHPVSAKPPDTTIAMSAPRTRGPDHLPIGRIAPSLR